MKYSMKPMKVKLNLLQIHIENDPSFYDIHAICSLKRFMVAWLLINMMISKVKILQFLSDDKENKKSSNSGRGCEEFPNKKTDNSICP